MLDRTSLASIEAAANVGAQPVGGWPKRIFDLAFAAIALAVLSPTLVLTAFLVKCSGPGPIFVRQPRIGYRGHRFYSYKFRTMAGGAAARLDGAFERFDAAPLKRASLEKSASLTARIGQMLRGSGLAELPQLLNVLRGDMSIVGPRPIIEEEIDRYSERIRDYFRARPGLTGLWQLGGSNNACYETCARFDQSYVREWSMSGDIAILIKAIVAPPSTDSAC